MKPYLLTAGFTSGEKATLPNDSHPSIESFGGIVVDTEAGIIQELAKFRFNIQSVCDRFYNRRRRSFRLLKSFGLGKELIDQFNGSAPSRFPFLKESSIGPFPLGTIPGIVFDLIKTAYEIQQRFDFEIAVVISFEQISAYMSPTAGNFAFELAITSK